MQISILTKRYGFNADKLYGMHVTQCVWKDARTRVTFNTTDTIVSKSEIPTWNFIYGWEITLHWVCTKHMLNHVTPFLLAFYAGRERERERDFLPNAAHFSPMLLWSWHVSYAVLTNKGCIRISNTNL